MSLSLTTVELFWICMVLKEMHISQPYPPTLWCDDSRALALTSNPIFHARTKHIEVDVHFVREKVANRDIQLHHLSTLEQLAGIFTKGHSTDGFCYIKGQTEGCSSPQFEGEFEGGGVKDNSPTQNTNQPVRSQPKEDTPSHSTSRTISNPHNNNQSILNTS